jgi:hypothetical protein
MTAASLIPVAGGIVDPSTAAAVDYTTWPASYLTGYLLVQNTSTTAPVYLVTDDTETESGRAIAAGATASFGPYFRLTDLWFISADSADVYYSFDLINSEGY